MEYHAEFALFIAPKLYYLRLFNGETIIKARTLGGELLNENDFLEFGNTKVIIVSSMIDDTEVNFHHNVFISNDSTFEDYYDAVKDIVNSHYEHGYPVDIIQSFKVRV